MMFVLHRLLDVPLGRHLLRVTEPIHAPLVTAPSGLAMGR